MQLNPGSFTLSKKPYCSRCSIFNRLHMSSQAGAIQYGLYYLYVLLAYLLEHRYDAIIRTTNNICVCYIYIRLCSDVVQHWPTSCVKVFSSVQ